MLAAGGCWPMLLPPTTPLLLPPTILPAATSPLLYPDDWLPTDPTDPAGDGVGDSGEGVPCPPHCSGCNGVGCVAYGEQLFITAKYTLKNTLLTMCTVHHTHWYVCRTSCITQLLIMAYWVMMAATLNCYELESMCLSNYSSQYVLCAPYLKTGHIILYLDRCPRNGIRMCYISVRICGPRWRRKNHYRTEIWSQNAHIKFRFTKLNK